MKLKVLLLGKNGMLGSAFDKKLREHEGIECTSYGKEECSVTKFEELRAVMMRDNPDYVINCTGYTAVDNAEQDRTSAFALNGDAVGSIAKLCHVFNAKFIHFSTDYVFGGGQKEGYGEDSEPHPINVYGESKWCGERMVKEFCEQYYIIRTSWLFGPGGQNFVLGILSLAAKGGPLRVVDDQVGSPTYTYDVCDKIIEEFVLEDKEYGTYHLTNKGHCSWYGFALEIFRRKGLELEVKAITSEEFQRPAKRPKCSILLNNKMNDMREWKSALEEYLNLHV